MLISNFAIDVLVPGPDTSHEPSLAALSVPPSVCGDRSASNDARARHLPGAGTRFPIRHPPTIRRGS